MGDTQIFDFDSPLNQSSYIKVIGVGGGGNNAVNHMFRKGINGVDFIVTNTDMKALNGSPVPNKLALGHEGLGVGGRPSRARKAAEEKEKEIKELFEHNTKMIFITAGMGGGTGTGAAPVVAKYAKEIKLEAEDDDDPSQILVVAVVTTPFLFEGNRRIQQAYEGVEELRKYVDSILVINNEKLRSYGNLVLSDAFSMANDVLLTAVKSIAEIITLNACVNIDFRDVYTVMEKSGTALMGIGEGEGEDRALQAVEQATTSVLLNDNDIAGAKNVLLYFSYSEEHQITMDEMGVITSYITSRTGSDDTNVIWGNGFDDTLGDKIKITLIATGFETKKQEDPEVHVLHSESPEASQTVVPSDIVEPTLIPSRQKQDVSPIDIDPRYGIPSATETASTVAQMQGSARGGGSNPFPQVDSNPQPVAHHGGKNVIPLDEEDMATSKRIEPHDDKDDIIVLKEHSAGEATAAVKSQTVAQPVVETKVEREPAPRTIPAAGNNPLDRAPLDRAARIKLVHDLLHNNPNGPQIVEDMRPAKINDEDLYQMVHSSRSDVHRTVVNSDGSIAVVKNGSLYDLPD